MDANQIMRAQQLISRACALCAKASDLGLAARLTRARIGDQIRGTSARRIARLAQGGSRDPITETRQRRCPLCQGGAIKQGGAVSAVNGTIKSLYACESCGAPFLWVRDVIQRPQDGQA